jgi:rRNA processing protein Krr1/Pno1
MHSPGSAYSSSSPLPTTTTHPPSTTTTTTTTTTTARVPTPFSKTFNVSNQRIGLVIGREGASKRAIELEHWVDVNIITSSPGTGPISSDHVSEITIRGPTQAQVDAAAAMALAFAREKLNDADTSPPSTSGGGAGSHTVAPPTRQLPQASGVTVVPDLARGALIGHVGRSVRILQAVTGCQINVHASDPSTGTTSVLVDGLDTKSVDAAIRTVQDVVAAERIRLAIKSNPATPHEKRIVEIPVDVSFGSICGRNWCYLTQVQLQFGCIVTALNRDSSVPVQLEIIAPSATQVSKATAAVMKLVDQAHRTREHPQQQQQQQSHGSGSGSGADGDPSSPSLNSSSGGAF